MLVGRQDELAICDEVIDRLLAGVGGSLLVEGEAGIGKSTLLDYLGDQATAHGVQVRRAASDRFAVAWLFHVIAEVTGEDTSPAVDEVIDGAQGPGLLDGPRPESSSAAERHVDAIERVCLREPLVVVIDDVQWIDSGSLQAVVALVRRTGDLPLVVAIGCRSGSFPPDITHARNVVTNLGIVLRLQPLDEVATLALVREVLGDEPESAVLRRVEGAAGNPFLIVEYSEAIAGRSRPDEERGAHAAALCRFDLVDQPTVELLQLASVLGSSFRVMDLATISGRRAAELLAPIGAARRANILVEVNDPAGPTLAFRHELLREALHDEIPEPVRIALHLEVGQSLAAAGEPLGSVAGHLVEGAGAGDVASIDLVLRTAADIMGHTPTVAVELLERALRTLPPRHRDRAALQTSLIDALCWAGDVDRASTLADAILDSGVTHEEHQRVLGQLIRTRFFRGRTEGLVHEAKRRIEAFDLIPKAEWPSSVLWERAEFALLSLFSFDVSGAVEVARETLELAYQNDDEPAIILCSDVLSWALASQGFIGEALECIDRAVRLADDRPGSALHRFSPNFFRAVVLDGQGRGTESRAALNAAFSSNAQSSFLSFVSARHVMSAVLYFNYGDWDDARAEALAQIDQAEDSGVRTSLPLAFAILGQIALHRGNLDEARERVDQGLAEISSGLPLGADWLMWTHGLLLEAEGRLDEARSVLELVADFAERAGAWTSVARVAVDLADLARADGDLERVEMLAAACELLAERSNGLAIFSAQAMVCRGDVVGAADLYRGLERSFEFAQTAERASLDRAEVRDTAASVRLGDEALGVYTQLGATRCIDRVKRRLASLGIQTGRRRTPDRPAFGWESLTDSEWNVVRLVVKGLTNAEVAALMGNSKRTVEAHLRHVFVKLDISSRVALANRHAAEFGA